MFSLMVTLLMHILYKKFSLISKVTKGPLHFFLKHNLSKKTTLWNIFYVEVLLTLSKLLLLWITIVLVYNYTIVTKYIFSIFRLQRLMIYEELDFGLAIFWITQMPHKFNLCGLFYHNLWWTLRGLLFNLCGLLYHNLWFNVLSNLLGLSLNSWIYVVQYSILFVMQINQLFV